MSKMKFEKANSVFGKDNIDIPSFRKDIEFFTKLQGDVLDKILQVYLGSKYKRYYHDHLEKFAEEISLPTIESHDIIHLLDFFGYHVVRHHRTDDVISAITELFEDFDSENFLPFLEKLTDEISQEILDTLESIDNEIGVLNPHFNNITYNIQQRIIVKNDKIIKKLPVVLLKIDTFDDTAKSITIEFLEDDFDELISGLGKIKEKLNLLNEKRDP